MAFSGFAFIGGAAQRGSEILQEERENVERITDTSLKFWTETGIGKYNERKAKRKDLSMKFDTLSRNGFSGDQIELIAREGGIDKVLDHIETAKSRKMKIKPAEIVRFSDDYKDTGRTKEQIINSVMGKVNRGMDVSDAIIDSGGKTTGFLGQDLGKIARKRAEAFGSAFGMPVDQLRALATDDITIEDSPISGQLFLEDEVAAAQAEAIIKGKEQGQISQLSAMKELQKRAASELGVGLSFDDVGNPIYKNDDAELAIQALDIGMIAAEGYQTLRSKNKDITSIGALKQATEDMLSGMGQPALPSGKNPSSQQIIQTPPSVGMGVFGGMTTSSIQAQVLKDAKGVNIRQQAIILEQAKQAIIKDLEKTMTPADAIVEAEAVIDKIESQL